MISDPGIYNCINRGSVYAENGTYENGAGGIVGTGGLLDFRNPDFAVFYCLNLGEISGNDSVKVAGLVGNGHKFSEQRSYYTNCDHSSDNDEAINFTAAGMSKQEVVEQMSSSFKYEDGEIYLNFDNDTPGDAVDESAWSIETETFSETVQEKNVTMPAPELTCELISHYFGSVVDEENITVKYPKTEGVCKWIMEVASDPEFTDIQMRTAGNPSTEAYALRPGVPYYIRAYGVNTYGTPDENTEYTGTSYLNVMLEDYGVLVATVPNTEPETPALQPGDCTGDEVINASDASQILIASAQVGAGDVTDLTEEQLKAADVNGDGAVNSSDAAVILMYAAAIGAGNLDAKITDFI
ncbi:MAG: dockerin type I repeat-containing protein, partial [Oscillospiraceae bacterium]|nr:dockerin type I repeat-containing protein [Oscillospiraceae bacterium]